MSFISIYDEGRYNRKLVKLTNLNTAVYWSELLEIIEQVVRKKKFDDDGYFKLDRKYMEDQTGIQTINLKQSLYLKSSECLSAINQTSASSEFNLKK